MEFLSSEYSRPTLEGWNQWFVPSPQPCEGYFGTSSFAWPIEAYTSKKIRQLLLASLIYHLSILRESLIHSTSNMAPPFPSLTQTWHNTSYDAISPTRHELSVANKTVIVTGGGRGLGAEMARAFAAAGASRVVLIGRTQSTLSQTAENIEKEFASVSVSTYAAHVADEDAMGKVAEKVEKWDVLILNAGLLAEPKPIETANVADWWRIFEVSDRPPHYHCIPLLPLYSFPQPQSES